MKDSELTDLIEGVRVGRIATDSACRAIQKEIKQRTALYFWLWSIGLIAIAALLVSLLAHGERGFEMLRILIITFFVGLILYVVIRNIKMVTQNNLIEEAMELERKEFVKKYEDQMEDPGAFWDSYH